MAKAYEGTGKFSDALKSYDEYLKNNAIDTDARIARANIKLKLGDTAGAQADFKATLTYIPGDQRAMDGLKKIGAGK
jgi:hypothetical protein